MNTYLISYDLIRAPEKDYTHLIAHLKGYSKWARPLESVWLVKSPLTAEQVRNAARAHMDANDKMLVVDITKRAAAWVNLSQEVSTWIHGEL